MAINHAVPARTYQTNGLRSVQGLVFKILCQTLQFLIELNYRRLFLNTSQEDVGARTDKILLSFRTLTYSSAKISSR